MPVRPLPIEGPAAEHQRFAVQGEDDRDDNGQGMPISRNPRSRLGWILRSDALLQTGLDEVVEVAVEHRLRSPP